MKKVAVILRVYNRIDDLLENLRIIRSRWSINQYYIITSANGKSNGFLLPDEVSSLSNIILEADENAGHIKGNSQLLLQAVEVMPKDTEYVVILEADTWLADDNIINKYIDSMLQNGILWSSSEWIEKYWSLGVDFAVIEASFLFMSYKDLFNFAEKPERWVADYIIKNNIPYQYINELMPVHVPALIRKIYNGYGGRFRIFPKGKMVTHHIEDLPNSLTEKKFYFDSISDIYFYKKRTGIKYLFYRYIYTHIHFIIKFIPRSSWFKKKQHTYI